MSPIPRYDDADDDDTEFPAYDSLLEFITAHSRLLRPATVVLVRQLAAMHPVYRLARNLRNVLTLLTRETTAGASPFSIEEEAAFEDCAIHGASADMLKALCALFDGTYRRTLYDYWRKAFIKARCAAHNISDNSQHFKR